jgi:oligosaccharide translocation protein RFT1
VKDKNGIHAASVVLAKLLLLFMHLLLLLVTFGPPYLPLVGFILLPPRFQNTSAPAILRTYVFYIPMMAFNGVLEAFFASTATPGNLRNQSRWMMVFSLGFICTAVGSNKAGFGDSGLVYANISNLCARVIYCWIFTKRYFGSRGSDISLRDTIPPTVVLGVFTASAIVTRWSWKMHEGIELGILQQRNHLAVGVTCLAVCLGTWFVYWFDRRLTRALTITSYHSAVFERVFFRELFRVLSRK